MTELVSQVIRRARKTYKCDAWETLYEMADYEGVSIKKCRNIKKGDAYEEEIARHDGALTRIRSCLQCVCQLQDDKLWGKES